MIKRTLYFGNPAYLSLRNGQLVFQLPEVAKNENADEWMRRESVRTFPVEDLGLVVLDHRQITITQALLAALLDNQTAVITCDARSMPAGLLLPLDGHTLQSERFRHQLESSLPLRKQLWQQTVRAKIRNQAAVLQAHTPAEVRCLQAWAADVRSGDADNLEARAAAYYWKSLFAGVPVPGPFTRDREGAPPNNLLNYGYAILRAVIARSLVSSGLLPTFGIHHHNRYNAYCLADDIMEPYRPLVDSLVFGIVNEYGGNTPEDITKELKMRLLGIPVTDVRISGKRSPLMLAATQTTASLYKCFTGEVRRIAYPVM